MVTPVSGETDLEDSFEDCEHIVVVLRRDSFGAWQKGVVQFIGFMKK